MKTREDKNKLIESIAEKLNEYSHFYLTDISGLNAEQTSGLRRKCYEKDIQMMVVKNTLLRKAFDKIEGSYDELFDTLKGNTSVMFANTGNAPAKLIKEFRKGNEKPILKGAFVEEGLYIGDENLETLISIKSKEEVIGDIITILQSPIKNLISSLESGKNIISGVVKTLSEK